MVTQIIEKASREQGISRRNFRDEEIIERYPLDSAGRSPAPRRLPVAGLASVAFSTVGAIGVVLCFEEGDCESSPRQPNGPHR